MFWLLWCRVCEFQSFTLYVRERVCNAGSVGVFLTDARLLVHLYRCIYGRRAIGWGRQVVGKSPKNQIRRVTPGHTREVVDCRMVEGLGHLLVTDHTDTHAA